MNSIDALLKKAISEISKDDFNSAYQDFKKAYKINPEQEHICYFLGQAAEKINKTEAIEWYQKSIERNEDGEEAQERIKALKSSEDADYSLEFIESNKTFDDLIGMEKIKESLTAQVIHAVQYPKIFQKHKKKIGLGIVFYGPPGCGKTFLARCLAGEAQKQTKKTIKVAVIRISKILDMYVGNSEKNVSRVFEQARKNAPCILFFDEFDALGRTRSSNSNMASDSSTMSKVVDELLAEMDGIEQKAEGIFVIAATNRPWEIDESLKRSGRFSNVVYVRPPIYSERIKLFQLYLKDKPQARLGWGRLARATTGFSQADIAQICDDISMIPIEREIKTHKEQKITMGMMLNKILHEKSTIAQWYISMKKELVGVPKVEIINGKKYTNYTQGKLDAEEKKLYNTLIDDIHTNVSAETALSRSIVRDMALFVI